MSGTAQPSATLGSEERQYLASLEGFAKVVLGFGDEVYPWMADLFGKIEQHGSRTSIRTCNGAGKTSRIFTAVILWALAIFPKVKVVYTTASARQLRYQLWPALSNRSARFDGWEFRMSNYSILTPRGGQFVGFATDNAGRAEGWHGNKDPLYDLDKHDGPLIFLIDEAKTVPDPIYEAIDRCTVQRLVEASSPGYAQGAFYRHHTSESRFFHTARVHDQMCPHVDHEANKRLIEQYGAGHPLVMSKVKAEFMDESEDAVIPLRVVDEAMDNAPGWMPGLRRAHFDFAAGGDENVFALRDGNRIELVKCWRETDTMKAVGEFIRLMREHKLKPEDCSGDNGGMGIPIIDRMYELGWPIRRINNQASANDSETYVNWSAETWFEGRAALGRHAVILPDDEDLRMQLTGRKSIGGSKGRLGVERKPAMKKRGVCSPDRADAVLELMREPVRMHSVPLQGDGKSNFWDERFGMQEERELDEAVIRGMNAGM